MYQPMSLKWKTIKKWKRAIKIKKEKKETCEKRKNEKNSKQKKKSEKQKIKKIQLAIVFGLISQYSYSLVLFSELEMH